MSFVDVQVDKVVRYSVRSRLWVGVLVNGMETGRKSLRKVSIVCCLLMWGPGFSRTVLVGCM